MTLAELDRMESIADQINTALGIREQIPELHATAARDRQAAYTLFIEAYDEVRAAIAYVRRNEGDVDSIMPSLYAGRGGGSKKKTTVEEPTQPSPAATRPNPVATPAPAPGATAPTEARKSAFGDAHRPTQSVKTVPSSNRVGPLLPCPF